MSHIKSNRQTLQKGYIVFRPFFLIFIAFCLDSFLDERLAHDEIETDFFFEVDEHQREGFNGNKTASFEHPSQHCNSIIFTEITKFIICLLEDIFFELTVLIIFGQIGNILHGAFLEEFLIYHLLFHHLLELLVHKAEWKRTYLNF